MAFAQSIVQFCSDVYEPFMQAFLLDPLRPLITEIGAQIERIPSTPLPEGKPMTNEATWYVTPEEHAERWVIIVLLTAIATFIMWRTGAFVTVRRGWIVNRSQRHPRLAIVCFATLFAITYFKHLRGAREVIWMFMPCHIFLALTGLWAVQPYSWLLDVVMAFRMNSLIATVLPDSPNTSFPEVVLFYVEHFILDFFPSYALLRGYEISSNSLTWGTLIIIVCFSLYGIFATIVGLIWDLNLCYILSPPESMKPLHCKSFYTVSVIAHGFMLIGGHMLCRAEAFAYSLCPKRNKQN